MIKIYTDGASRGNPGPGAYAAIITYGDHQQALSKGFRRTTNNRMELLGVIVALETLGKDKQLVQVYSDSKYVVDAVQKGWLQAWVYSQFKGKKNVDLWQRFWALYQRHQIVLHWVKGHAGDPYNEKCDQLASACIQTGPWAIDVGYERA
ncbi:MAG: ribonuclease HI [Bacteroidota bacterium]